MHCAIKLHSITLTLAAGSRLCIYSGNSYWFYFKGICVPECGVSPSAMS
jgi:hypothetical protein